MIENNHKIIFVKIYGILDSTYESMVKINIENDIIHVSVPKINGYNIFSINVYLANDIFHRVIKYNLSIFDNSYLFNFDIPDNDVIIEIQYIPDNKEDINSMEDKEKDQNIVGSFEIPDELAKELSELLTTQMIRERVLTQVVNEPDKYESVEKMLIPVVQKIEAIKLKITNEFVPAEFNSIKYVWNYNGYEVDGNKVQVIKID